MACLKDVEELFDEFQDCFDCFDCAAPVESYSGRQEEPVASGSVGQVHRARLRAEHALDGPGVPLMRFVYVFAIFLDNLYDFAFAGSRW